MTRLAMPKDGNCIFHCLRHHLGQKRQKEAQGHWKQIAPCDEGDELQSFLPNTEDSSQWGNAYHIALATHIRSAQITLHHKGFGNYDFGAQGKQFYLLYSGDIGSTTGTHYDVLTKEEETKTDDRG